jgi:phosphocarrier protein HPr
MKKLTIRLKDIQAVKKFVTKVSLYPFDIDLLTGRYIIDAKSIMGILSLDLDKELTCVLHTEQCDDIMKDIGEFIVSED